MVYFICFYSSEELVSYARPAVNEVIKGHSLRMSRIPPKSSPRGPLLERVYTGYAHLGDLQRSELAGKGLHSTAPRTVDYIYADLLAVLISFHRRGAFTQFIKDFLNTIYTQTRSRYWANLVTSLDAAEVDRVLCMVCVRDDSYPSEMRGKLYTYRNFPVCFFVTTCVSTITFRQHSSA